MLQQLSVEGTQLQLLRLVTGTTSSLIIHKLSSVFVSSLFSFL